MPITHNKTQPATWVGGNYDYRLDRWESGYWKTEGELFNSLDTALTVDYYSETHMKLMAICVVDEVLERLR